MPDDNGSVRRPAHHAPGGGFRNPWNMAGAGDGRGGGFLRWQIDRLQNGVSPTPKRGTLATVPSQIALPFAHADEMRVTWIGHSSLLLQTGAYNFLADPVWSRRASPFAWAGPARYTPVPFPIEQLPHIHGVLISHDHYDHLDDATVRALSARFGANLEWFAPLGYNKWLRDRGAQRVHELDWWQHFTVGEGAAELTITALPAQHWTRRMGSAANARLWCSWSVRHATAGNFYFAGDSGYCPAFTEIAQMGPFRACAIPIGAYEPRWFMRPAHMNPEEAVLTYTDLGGTGTFCAIHWGTFRLTDEPPLEPPVRTRAAWHAAGLPESKLWIAHHGETCVVPPLGAP